MNDKSKNSIYRPRNADVEIPKRLNIESRSKQQNRELYPGKFI